MSPGPGDAARLPQALFPGLILEVAVGLPVPCGKNDFHALVLTGGPLADAHSNPALGRRFQRHFQTALERFLPGGNENSIVLALRGFVANSCTGPVTLD